MTSDECIFCQIVSGDLPSYTVMSTDDAVAFLDVNPLAAGHTLVIPTSHRERLQDFSADEAGTFWQAVHTLLPAVESAVDADAITVGVNNGEASGQEVPHAHVHVVPRFDGDGGNPVHAVGGPPPSLDEDDFETIASAIEGSVD